MHMLGGSEAQWDHFGGIASRFAARIPDCQQKIDSRSGASRETLLSRMTSRDAFAPVPPAAGDSGLRPSSVSLQEDARASIQGRTSEPAITTSCLIERALCSDCDDRRGSAAWRVHFAISDCTKKDAAHAASPILSAGLAGHFFWSAFSSALSASMVFLSPFMAILSS